MIDASIPESKRNLRDNIWLILGLPFDNVNIQQCAEILLDHINNRKRCFLSTPNINFTVAASQDEAFYDSVARSDLSIADGMPLIWLAKLAGLPIKERVAGSDLFNFMSSQTYTPPIRVFFFGGEPGTAERAHTCINQTSVGMVSVGFFDPGFVDVEQMSQSHIIDYINTSNADFLVVALGAKKGQAWIMNNMDKLNTPVISHLGAVVNFVAGQVERAPSRWQNYGLEWAWRIKQEPKLWQRYLWDGIALIKLLLFKQLPYWIYNFFCQRKIHNKAVVTFVGNRFVLSGSFLKTNLDEFVQQVNSILEDGTSRLELDMASVSYVDSAFMARLVTLRGLLINNKGELIIISPSKNVKKLLRLAGVHKYLNVLE